MDRMRRVPVLVLTAAVTAAAVVGVQAATVLDRPGPEPVPRVRTVTRCPDGPVLVTDRPVPLVADLATVVVRDSPSRAALLAGADQVLAGTIPVVRPRPVPGEDRLRYLYDAGVALRRVVGVLGYAYAATDDPRYLDAMAAQTVRAARWPDWNQLPGGHPLDTAQVGTAVALGYAWSRTRMSTGERVEVLAALETRLVSPYVCGAGGLAARRDGDGNQATVVGAAVLLAGLAARGERSWADPAVWSGSEAVGRHAAADGSGRSLADGPTDEGLMYTNYEAASVALLDATVRATRGQPELTRRLAAALPSLDALASWNEHCGRVVEPAVQDGWDLYPWVDRTTALADMARYPDSGPRLLGLYEALQARGRLTLPGVGEWAVPDGIAELVRSQLTPGTAAPAAPPDLHVAGGSASARSYGCATAGDTYALVTAVPNDSPHAHADVGNVVVKQGETTLLDDLGQRSYAFTGSPVWRASTEAHSTVGVGQPDGTVLQHRSGAGAVTVDGTDLVMTSTSALPGVASWQRRVTVADGAVRVRDDVTSSAGASVPLSASFLLAAPPSAVAQLPDGTLHLTVADGSSWVLVPPSGVTVTLSDASPRPPYVDAPDLAAAAAGHTLVVLRRDVAGSAELTTELHRVYPTTTGATVAAPPG